MNIEFGRAGSGEVWCGLVRNGKAQQGKARLISKQSGSGMVWLGSVP